MFHRTLIETLAVISISIVAVIPWDALGYPPQMVMAAVLGATIAVFLLPDDLRNARSIAGTLVVGIGVSLLLTQALLEYMGVESVAKATAFAGLLALGGLPIAGATLRYIDIATNDPKSLVGGLLRSIFPALGKPQEPQPQPPPEKPNEQPPTGRT